MVGSMKLTKIHFRLQDLADGEDKLRFMGGRSVVTIGDLWQLPPIYDNIVLDNNRLDGRPDFAPSHFKENFKPRAVMFYYCGMVNGLYFQVSILSTVSTKHTVSNHCTVRSQGWNDYKINNQVLQ